MAKRRLTDQQKRRIAANKQNLTDPVKNTNDNNIFDGLVVCHHGRKLVVETEDQQRFSCKFRQNLGDIACGDNVVIQLEKKSIDEQQTYSKRAIVVAVNDRSNLLEKTGFGDKAKVVAANISQVVVVCSVKPEPNPYLIDRYLVATENLGADALIIANKSDLINDSNKATINNLKEIYEKIGYRLILTSVKNNTGMKSLKAELVNTTSILVGLSGVGKSALIKQLVPESEIRIGEISEATGEGKHTTTVSSLYHLQDGGSLIDSPGVRDFTPWNRDKEDIVNGFVELRNYQGYCKFSNCSHTSEPGCAITEALKNGELSQQRVNSFKKMIEDLQS
jgi:ribosome biogenesis GTPase